jgi:archaellum biogenesis protein FlaJ (TadC family)
MSFREKSAWISFVTILAVFIPFFWNSYRQYQGAISGRDAVGTAFTLLTAFVVLEIVLHVVLALRAPKDARTPRDEREQLIDMRATRVGFYVLLVGALAAVGMVHLTSRAWVIQQVVLLAIVLAELVRFGGQIVLFRRDA